MLKVARNRVVVFFIFLLTCLLFAQYFIADNMQSGKIFMEELIKEPVCGRFPLIADLNISDTNWQVTNTTNGTFYLFNAYFDDRKGLASGTVVRILALINRIDPTVTTYCQMWYEDFERPTVVSVHEYRLLWPKFWGTNDKGASPYLIVCRPPENLTATAPQFVALVESRCAPSNNALTVRNRRLAEGQRKRRFLVSVKGVDFEDDVSLQLIEWCEILKLFAVDHVEVFVVRAHANLKRTLAFYEIAFITVKFLTLPHELPNKLKESWHQWSQNDLVPYQDSFYENFRLYEYMVPMDIDEFIIPVRDEDRTWTDLLTRTIERSRLKKEKNPFDCFPATNRYFLLKSAKANETVEGVPKHLRFLSNIHRAVNATPNGGHVKTFMRMDRILGVHNHFPFSCIRPEHCRIFNIHISDGHLAHYRSDCDEPECKETQLSPARDTILWKYKEELLSNVNATLERLKAFYWSVSGDKIEISP